MQTRKIKKDRERPSLSILCEMYGACEDPGSMTFWYGTNGYAWCQQYMEAAGTVGKNIHAGLDVYENTGSIPKLEDPREDFMVSLGAKWLQETGAEAKAIELDVTSKLLDFTARLDRVHTFKNDRSVKWIGDYKTSSAIRQAYCMQLAGYALGYFELTGEWIDQGYLLRIDKNPNKTPQIKRQEVYELHRWIEPLVLMRQMWDHLNRKNDWSSYGKYEDKSC
jgi:hypothetical protein